MRPVSFVIDEVGFDRVADDVSGDLLEVFLVAAGSVPHARLPERSEVAFVSGEASGPGFPGAEEGQDVAASRRDEEVEVVGHQACGVEGYEARDSLFENRAPDGFRDGRLETLGLGMGGKGEVEDSIGVGVFGSFCELNLLGEAHRAMVVNVADIAKNRESRGSAPA